MIFIGHWVFVHLIEQLLARPTRTCSDIPHGCRLVRLLTMRWLFSWPQLLLLLVLEYFAVHNAERPQFLLWSDGERITDDSTVGHFHPPRARNFSTSQTKTREREKESLANDQPFWSLFQLLLIYNGVWGCGYRRPRRYFHGHPPAWSVFDRTNFMGFTSFDDDGERSGRV